MDDNNDQDIDFWVDEIKNKGFDAVASILVSKMGTPEAATIQMAIVEYHRKNDIKQSKLAGLDTDENSQPPVVKLNIALVIAFVALLISIVSLVLTLTND